MSRSTMLLGAMIFYPGGEHVTSWRLPGSQPTRYLQASYYGELARTAERAGFAALFVADELYVWDRFASGVEHAVNIRPEPFTLLGALSATTERIGLVATVSTTYNEPYHVARKLASLDHLSGGRAGWNLVTSASDEEAWNFGRDANLDHATRYRRGAEFVDVVTGLWDSWDDDAIVADAGSGRYADPDGLHVLDHQGEFFRVRGPLNLARPPQGHPVLFQAGGSEAGRALAGASAEVVFALGDGVLSHDQALYADYHRRAREAGRAPGSLKVLPAVMPVVGESRRDALEQVQRIEALTPDRVSLDLLSHYLHVDLSDRPLDEPFTVESAASTNQQSQTMHAAVHALVGDRRVTLRDVYRKVLRRRFLPGTPDRIADWLAERFTSGAADGFMIASPSIPVGFEAFTSLVVPELVRRGVYRTEPEGETLREQLGLARPASRWAREAR